jgi:hypothetical protein
MSRKPQLPKGFFLWSESLRRKWVDDYNRSLPELNAKIAERNKTNMQRRERDREIYGKTPTPAGYQWLNCETNPDLPSAGFNAGRSAWKFHAVVAEPNGSLKELKLKRVGSACGIVPHYGWTLDLFMDENDSVAGKCMRCLKRLAPIVDAIYAEATHED